MALLKIANLKKSYKINKTQKQDVLKGIDIEFKSGDLVALLGESGCGKSTLINILGGLDMDYTGSVVIKNDYIRDFTEEQMDDYRKKRVGLIFQGYNLINHMTLLENIEIAMSISNISESVRRERALDLLKMVGLANYAKKLPTQLSGGQKQRVAIVRAIANNPTIVLADEPTGALDKDAADVVMQILKKIAQMGKLVIIVTHSEKVANECGRVIKLEEGKIVSDKKINHLHIEKERDKEIKPQSIKTKDIAKLSFENLKQNKGRSLLVSIGMSIGIAVFILILCLSSGLASYVNNIYNTTASALQLSTYKSSYQTITTTEISNIENLEGIESILQTSLAVSSILYEYDTESGTIAYANCCYDDFSPTLLYGTLPTSSQIAINSTFATALASGEISAVIGQEITLTNSTRSDTYVISGIYQDNSSYSSSINAYMNASDLSALLNSFKINKLYITAEDATYLSAIMEDLNMMGYETEQEDSSVQNIISYIDIGTGVLSAISAISMFVSGIMIFIVLYISVVERMKEIGILRAIGARKKDIKKMFIFEAGSLGILGGVLGCAICLTLTIITNIICLATISYSLISYDIGYYFIGILCSLIISLVSGIAPSIYASDLDPVESLRRE